MRTKNMKYESKGIMKKKKMKNIEMRREKKLALKKLEISYDSPFFFARALSIRKHISHRPSHLILPDRLLSDTRARIQFAGFFLAGFGIFSYAFGLGARLLSLDFPFALLLGPCPQFLLCVWPWPSSSLSSSEEESLSSLEDSSYARGRR